MSTPRRITSVRDRDHVRASPKGRLPLDCGGESYRPVVSFQDQLSRATAHYSGIESRSSADERSGSLHKSFRFSLFSKVLKRAFRFARSLVRHRRELTYPRWIRQFDTLTFKDRQLIRKHLRNWPSKPRFEIVVFACDHEPEALRQTMRSLGRQLYRGFGVTLVTNEISRCRGFKLRLPSHVRIMRWSTEFSIEEIADGLSKDIKGHHWLVFLEPGMRLRDHTLYWISNEVIAHPNLRLIYCDHDEVDASGARTNPAFKPDWSPELLRSTNYIDYAFAVRSDACRIQDKLSARNGLAIGIHGLLLAITGRLKASAIRHIPSVLWHLRLDNGMRHQLTASKSPSQDGIVPASLGVEATLECTQPGRYRWHYSLPDPPPRVSIIVPTRDAFRYLTVCVASVLEKSSYKYYELIIVDNGSSTPQTLGYLSDLSRREHVRVLSYDKPFNYSEINNFAASFATGAVLCFLNNDTEVITPDWLETMVGHLVQPKVGVVGAKLYYSDGRVQHAGDAVGPGGCADHLHSKIEHEAPGYCDRAVLAQDLSAVTGACLMTWRHVYMKLGGLNARDLPIAFNDVDYCLRAREAGYRVVWTPFAELYHHESASRGNDPDSGQKERAQKEIEYMRLRWKKILGHDPFYNPNLSYERPDFSLNKAPRISRPWLYSDRICSE